MKTKYDNCKVKMYDRFCNDSTYDLFREYQLRSHTGRTIGRIPDHRLRRALVLSWFSAGSQLCPVHIDQCVKS